MAKLWFIGVKLMWVMKEKGLLCLASNRAMEHTHKVGNI